MLLGGGGSADELAPNKSEIKWVSPWKIFSLNVPWKHLIEHVGRTRPALANKSTPVSGRLSHNKPNNAVFSIQTENQSISERPRYDFCEKLNKSQEPVRWSASALCFHFYSSIDLFSIRSFGSLTSGTLLQFMQPQAALNCSSNIQI